MGSIPPPFRGGARGVSFPANAKFCVSRFCHHRLGRNILDFAQLSRQRINLIDFAFDNEGDDGHGAVVEGQALARQHNAGVTGNHLVHMRRRRAV